MAVIIVLIVLGLVLFGTGFILHGLLWLIIIGAVLAVAGIAWGAGKRIGSGRDRQLP